MTIQELANKKILILDGAMGTMIQRHKFKEEDFRNDELINHPKPVQGNNALLSITQREVIREIHEEYLKAGADIIETNTFNSTSISQADYGLEGWAYRINKAAAEVAKEATAKFSTEEHSRFVAGSIGPTNRTASLSPDVNRPGFRAITFDELKDAYAEQTNGLIDGGADVLLVETVFDTLNAKAALLAVQSVMKEKGVELPIMVSGTITDESGRTLSGQTARAFMISLSHVPLFSIGFNCALGADQLIQYVDVLSQHSNAQVSAHPNAGLPNAMGEYDQDATVFSNLIEPYFERELVNVIGGCCGTTPEHIKKLSELASQYSPRKLEDKVTA